MTDNLLTEDGPVDGAPDSVVAARVALLEMINGYWVSQVVRAAADLRLADHLTDGARTAAEVAERESSDLATTYRLMRACAAIGLLGLDRDGRFSVTPLGGLLRSGVPGSMRDSALALTAPGHWLPWGWLPDAVRQGCTQARAVLGADVFEYLAGQPVEERWFAAAMASITSATAAQAARVIDTGSVSLAVDIGGGTGELVRALMHADPALRGHVMDLPRVVDAALRAAEADGLGERFTAGAGDFFAAVPGADLYLLRSVLHDWDDGSCVRILRNCRAAALPGARLLVLENVIGEPGQDRFAALLDMNMLAVTGGQERDLAGYDALAAASGWTRTEVLTLPGSRSILEYRPADTVSRIR